MDASALCSAYAHWLTQPGPALDRLTRLDREVSVLLVGMTVTEAARLVRALTSALPAGLHVQLMRPLGDGDAAYAFWERPGAAAVAATALQAALQQHVEVRVTGRPELDLSELADHELDMLALGPLAFGVLDGGAAARDAGRRAALAADALSKTRLGHGIVLVCARECMDWQRSLYGHTVFRSLQAEQAVALQAACAARGAFVLSTPISASLPISDALLADLQTFARVNSLNAVQEEVPADALDLLLRLAGRDDGLGAAAAAAAAPNAASGGNVDKAKDTDDAGNAESAANAGAQADKHTLPERGLLMVVSWDKIATGTMAAAAAAASAAAAAEEEEKAEATNHPSAAHPSVTDPAAWWPHGRGGEFFNCGHDLWQRQREEWLAACAEVEVTPAAPIPYEEVIAGLASLRRTYELPHPIRLPDLIDIYLDIWESQDGY